MLVTLSPSATSACEACSFHAGYDAERAPLAQDSAWWCDTFGAVYSILDTHTAPGGQPLPVPRWGGWEGIFCVLGQFLSHNEKDRHLPRERPQMATSRACSLPVSRQCRLSKKVHIFELKSKQGSMTVFQTNMDP
ncbi:hypothetical protein H8959_022804 [Pygathrix nigripes]